MRLIDADAFIDKFAHMPMVQDTLQKAIEHMPTVDAVPVIRCKNCRYWECSDEESFCEELGIFDTDMNSYCSYAKRKD